jgi:plastocyanin
MKQSTIIAIVVVVIVVVIAGVYVGTMNNNGGSNNGGNNGGNPPVVENPVSIASFAFTPNLITIHVGENVTWKNNDPFAHTVTNDGNSTFQFNHQLDAGSTFVLQFTQPGDYWYHCSIHSFMTHAHVRVLAAGA